MRAVWSTFIGSGRSMVLWSVLSLMAAGCGGDEEITPTTGTAASSSSSSGGVTPFGEEELFGEQDPWPAPTFEKTECKNPLAPDSTTYCGYVEVPLLHREPHGDKIKIYATVYPAKDPSTATTPLIYLTGGPGASTTDSNYVFENPDEDPDLDFYLELFGDNRDLIVMDQRGTNFSEPALYCNEELGPLREQAYKLTLSAAMELRLTGLSKCYTRLNGLYNLSAFNTNESAADVRDLALALGHKQINLYGASYGTRLAMTVMKLFPEVVENAVLDSTVPPEVNPFSTQPEGTAYALGALWLAAKAAFPDLQSQFYGTLAKMKANAPIPPITVSHVNNNGTTTVDVTVTGAEYANYVISNLRDTPPKTQVDTALPYNMTQIFANEDYTIVAEAYLVTLDFLFPVGEGGELGATALGFQESVNGAADGHYTSLDLINGNIDHFLEGETVREWARQMFIFQNANLVGLWPVTPLPPSVQYPLISSIPTLLMVGSLDSGTPLPFSEPSSHFLSNSFYFDILAGHAVCYLECASELMDDFLKDPSVEPTSSCPTDPQWKTMP